MKTDKKPYIISGPCSAETRDQTLSTCVELAKIGSVDALRAGIWKPRTMPGLFEGVGEEALEWLSEAKQLTGLPIAVEVANASHVEIALKHNVDILWIGARTTANPFSVQEIAESLRGCNNSVFVKNPISPDVDLWQGAIQRLQSVGIKDIGLIHRGFTRYSDSMYRNEPMWHIAIEMRCRYPELMMLCDPSHICGKRDLIYDVAQQSAKLCYDGLVVESHICPAEAWSDAEQQLTPNNLQKLLESIVWCQHDNDSVEFHSQLEALRAQIDTIDIQVLQLLSSRMKISATIGEIKRENGVSILQSSRWKDIITRMIKQGEQMNLSQEFVRHVFEAIHIESIEKQK